MKLSNFALLALWLGLGAITLASNRLGLDIWLSNWFFDAANNTFTYRDTPLFSHLLHSKLKQLVVVIGLGLFGRLIWLKYQAKRGVANTHVFLSADFLLWLLVSGGICATAVAAFKSQSMHACPWSLSIFGGDAQFFELLTPATGSPGRCFPSGHASIGWMWIPFFIAPSHLISKQLAVNPKGYRVIGLAIGLITLLSSATQIIRGAHFLSHVLATAWICLTITLLLKWCSEYQTRATLIPSSDVTS